MKNKKLVLVGLLSATLAASATALGVIATKHHNKHKGSIEGVFLIEFDSVELVGEEYSINLEGHSIHIDSAMVAKLEVAETYRITYTLSPTNGFDGEVVSIETVE